MRLISPENDNFIINLLPLSIIIHSPLPFLQTMTINISVFETSIAVTSEPTTNIRSLNRSFVRSFACLFIHSFCSFLPSSLHWSFTSSFYYLMRSFTFSFTHLFAYSWSLLLLREFARSLVRLLVGIFTSLFIGSFVSFVFVFIQFQISLDSVDLLTNAFLFWSYSIYFSHCERNQKPD